MPPARVERTDTSAAAKGDQAGGDTEDGAQQWVPGVAVANGLVTDTILLGGEGKSHKGGRQEVSRRASEGGQRTRAIQSWTSRMRNREPCSVRGTPRYSPGRSKKKKACTKHWAAALATGVDSAAVRVQTWEMSDIGRGFTRVGGASSFFHA